MEVIILYNVKQIPFVKMNNLKNLLDVLENENNEIIIDEEIRKRALIPLQRMIDFKK